MARQLENNFRARVCSKLKEIYAEKFYHQKLHGGFYQAGLVDTLIVFDGHTSHVEFKADTEREFEHDNITKLQEFTLRGVWLAGGLSGVWHWMHDKKLIQIFNYDVLKRRAWKSEGVLIPYDALLKDRALLKSALWHR